MREQLEKRLEELRQEFEAGQRARAELDAKQVELQKTLLRISGAIQVLEEELARTGELAADPVAETTPADQGPG